MHRILKSFDHATIFVLIAGSYTPFCVMVLQGGVASFLLIGLWSGAAIGVVSKIGWPYLPHTISLTWYMTMSWMGILALPQLIMALPWIALGFLGTGALCYTAGGIIFGLRKPNPLPHIFGYHELFHLLGVTANAIVIFTLFTWILPYA